MGRHRTRISSDTSDDTSESDYGSLMREHVRHLESTNTVSTRLRPRASRKNIDIDDFLESDEDDEDDPNAKIAPEDLPVALYNTIEKFLARRPAAPLTSHTAPSVEGTRAVAAPCGGDDGATPEVLRNGGTVASAPLQTADTRAVTQEEGTTNETQRPQDHDDPMVSATTDEKKDAVATDDSPPAPSVCPPSLPPLASTTTTTIAATAVSMAPSTSVPGTPTTIASAVSPIGMQAPTSSFTLATSVSAVKRRRREANTTHAPAVTGSGTAATPLFTGSYEYLVKYHNVSYLHCEWLSEDEVAEAIAHDRPLRTRFNNFYRRLEAGLDIPEADLVDAIPERIVDCSDQFRALYPAKAAEIGRNEWIMYCLKIVDALVCFTRDHRTYGVPFLRAVDEDKDGAPGYYAVVKTPMDFGTVQTKLYLRKYESPQEFWSDVKLVFSNCMAYNTLRTDISTQCRVLEALFDKLYYEWAKISREAAALTEGSDQPDECELPFVPLSEENLTLEKVIQHVSFKKQAQSSNRQILYLVKWKGRSYTEMSWELAEDISDKMKIAQYHRHVRVPEYIVDPRGPAYWETELQRRMLQETLLYCKAAKEFLHGNMAVSVQSLPTLSAAAPVAAKDNRWSYNAGPVRDNVPRPKIPPMFPHMMMPQDLSAADQQQRTALLCRNVQAPQPLMMGVPGMIQGRLTGVPLHMGGPGPFQPGFVDQRHPFQQDMFGNPLMAAAAFSRFGRPPVAAPGQGGTTQPRLVATQQVGGMLGPFGHSEPFGDQQFDASRTGTSGIPFMTHPGLHAFAPGFGFPPPHFMQPPLPQHQHQQQQPPPHQQQQPPPHQQQQPPPHQQQQHSIGPKPPSSVPQLHHVPDSVSTASVEGGMALPEVAGATPHQRPPDAVPPSPATAALCELGGSGPATPKRDDVVLCDWRPRCVSAKYLNATLPERVRWRLVTFPIENYSSSFTRRTRVMSYPLKSVKSPMDLCEGALPEPATESLAGTVSGSAEQAAAHPSLASDPSSIAQNRENCETSVHVSGSNNAETSSQVDLKDDTATLPPLESKVENGVVQVFKGDGNSASRTIATECTGDETTAPRITAEEPQNLPKVDTGDASKPVSDVADASKDALKSEEEGTAAEEDKVEDPAAAAAAATAPINVPAAASPVVVDRSRPASFAATSVYAEQFCQMKKPKPPPPGVSRQYPVSPTYKGNKKLFDYQLEGLNWLLALWASGNNGILADEMGLGKTIQSMALLWHLYTKEKMRGPFLVVAPLSTLDHWKISAENWTDFNVVLYYDEGGRVGRDALRRVEWYHHMADLGNRRGLKGEETSATTPRLIPTYHYKFQLLLTSYEIFASDAEFLVPIPWQFVVVDEAHRLKNRLSKTLQLLKQVACRHTLLLTGTPVQNNTEELWPLLNYIEPVRFCDLDAFKMEFGELQTNDQVHRLTNLLRPHLLRRVKEDVAESIPPLEETIIDVELTILQKAYYKAIFERNKNFLFKNVKKGQQLPSLMNVEMELRKCCNHPFMIHGVEQREYATCKTEAERFKKLVESSGKLVLLDKLLPKLKDEGHKVLVFSQFQHTLTLIQEFLQYKGWQFERLDGQVRGVERSGAITRFNDPGGDKFVFLLSTRAGGLGINLTSADTVIIFDSDWNPQNDIQATARAHRIGQEREVKVYRLVTARTYEADMFDRASKKLGLNTAVFHRGAFDSKTRSDKRKKDDEDGTSSSISSAKTPSKDEIEELLKKGAFYLLENSTEASREFQENNIEEILSRNSRLVRYQLTGMSSTFAKTSFKSDKASDLSLDDPDFWQKVLNDSSSRRLLARLNDGSATASPEAMDSFMVDLQAAVEGIAAEDDPEPVIEALVQLSNLTIFSSEHREQAEEWLARVNLSLESLQEAPAAASAGTRLSPSTPADGDVDGTGAGGDDDLKGLRRSTRVNRADPMTYAEDKLLWLLGPDEQRDRKKRGRLRKSLASTHPTEASGVNGAVGTDDGGSPLAGPDDDEFSKYERKLMTKFAENADSRVLYREALDNVLTDSPSEVEDEEDDDLGAGGGKRKSKTATQRQRTAAPQRAKRKSRGVKPSKLDDAMEVLDPETVAAAKAAGVPIPGIEVSSAEATAEAGILITTTTAKKQRKPRGSPGNAPKRRRASTRAGLGGGGTSQGPGDDEIAGGGALAAVSPEDASAAPPTTKKRRSKHVKLSATPVTANNNNTTMAFLAPSPNSLSSTLLPASPLIPTPGACAPILMPDAATPVSLSQSSGAAPSPLGARAPLPPPVVGSVEPTAIPIDECLPSDGVAAAQGVSTAQERFPAPMSEVTTI